MELIKLNCPNCGGKIQYKEGQTLKCPYCKTELLLKENKVYFVEQTINNYYGTPPARTATQPKANAKQVLLVFLVLICFVVGYFFLTNNSKQSAGGEANQPIRTMPESEVLLFFLRDIFDKGTALPSEEEIASLRYLSARQDEDQWHFAYSFDDPFTKEKAEIFDYVVTDKILNTQRIDQKDFEAFSGLTVLNLMEEYEISQNQEISFRQIQGLKSYKGGFNESFGRFAQYFGDKAKIVDLSTQIRSNAELALLLDFPNLQSLKITYVDESVTDFHLLNQLSLKSLSLNGIDDLKWLSALTGLESLVISYSEATDFSALYSLSQLRELKLSFTQNLKTLDFLQNMPNLQSLDLENAGISNLESLRNKLSLTKLRLSSMSKLGSVEPVSSLTSLTELAITGYYGSEAALKLPNLKIAEMPDTLLPMLEAPALQSLTSYQRRNDLDGEQLLKYPKLEWLSLEDFGDFTHIRALDSLPKLQTLNLIDMSFYEETSELFGLKHVTTINCNECSFQINTKQPFANASLEHLILNDISFRIGNEDWLNEVDKAMPYFAGLTALRSFTMQDSSLQSLDFMKGWQKIEVLHLENNAISNVEPLTSLSNLRKLYLVGNPAQNKTVLDKGILVY
ncbi:leucine-rich repeat domain-containing protein [Cohnella sp. LGH]|uniref:leucine-rich repeat domain-containing protein n=1 Tax=Cohnella sp. LGH TaxID=1619153 RepID=UPI001ADAA0BC|nr:leucine-rich repeat domain-containing protein [Cohnella sp. LGH]QTH42702.1 leucine-rich repeat domain-containing protein [Cohnella sp. LGH]